MISWRTTESRVITRRVTGKRNSGRSESTGCVCATVTCSVLPAASQWRAKVTFGYPMPYAHWSKNQSRSQLQVFSIATA